MRRMLLAGLAAVTAMGPTDAAAQSEPQVIVRAIRAFSPATRQTMVQVLVEVPYRLLEAPMFEANGELRFGVTAQVLDSAGGAIAQTSWGGHAKPVLRERGASKLEIIDFAVPPGRYRVAVTLTDSVVSRSHEAGTEVEAWGEPPLVSDLMLSPAIRLATGADSMPHTGELRWGNMMVTPAAALKLTPVRSRAYYLLEAYAPTADSGSMQVIVMDSTGRAIVTTRRTPVRIAQGGALLRGQLDLAGLPEGQYTLAVEVEVGDRKATSAGPLEMAGFQETMEREEARLAALKQTDEGYFGTMGADQVEAAFEPLIYLASSDSLAIWKNGLSLQAKKKFLTEFWKARDPSPGNPRNEAREGFYQLIAEANRKFRESGRNMVPGWKTDQGRVFARYGPTSETLDRPVPAGKAPPYLVWRYTKEKDLYFIFVDRTGLGTFDLIASNDLREPSQAGYEEILGAEALQDISRFLNIDLFRRGDSR